MLPFDSFKNKILMFGFNTTYHPKIFFPLICLGRVKMREGGRKGEREEHRCERDTSTSIDCHLSHMHPDLGGDWTCNPGVFPWLGIEPVTLCAWAGTTWALTLSMPARAYTTYYHHHFYQGKILILTASLSPFPLFFLKCMDFFPIS